MNRADRMLEALADGERRSRHEIFALAGGFFLTNNAAAELRARGLEIEQTRDAEEFYYQLHSLRDAEGTIRLGPAGLSASQSEQTDPLSEGEGASYTASPLGTRAYSGTEVLVSSPSESGVGNPDTGSTLRTSASLDSSGGPDADFDNLPPGSPDSPSLASDDSDEQLALDVAA